MQRGWKLWLALVMLILGTMLPTTALADAPAPLDLNSASLTELDGLPGIGPTRAAEIVRYRLLHDGFRRTSDLMRIKGIGRRTYQKLKPFIEVRPIKPARTEEVRKKKKS